MINKSDLPKFNPDIYTKITLNDLVVFSIHYLHNKNAEVKSEDIISTCFMLFPKRFFLRKHPHWPDSAMVSRHWSVCRSKGYITAGTEPGFKLTAKGVRLAEKVAKALGVATPKQVAKVQPVMREEKTIKPAAIKKIKHPQSIQKAKVVQKEKATVPAPAKKTQPPWPKVRTVTQTKETQPAQKGKAVLSVPTKKARAVRPKKKITPSRSARKVQPISPVRTRPTTPIKNVRPIWTKKTKPPAPVARSVMVEKARPTQPEKAIRPAVTQEVKVRAGKFVHLMEKSDAYVHYKKNGKSSKISEFDFRSLLLCTMESSPETLARNVEQFKGYAVIHNRQDLVAFLNFCADKLSYLLAPQIRQSTRRTPK